MGNNLFEKQNLFYGEVIDDQDPQKLGRIRALISPGVMNNVFRIPPDKINETGTDIQNKYKWQREDPFVYLPLLPFSVKITPKIGEFVHIFFGNSQYPQQNKFFIPGVLSSPTAVNYQNFEDAKTYLSDGSNYKEERSIQDKEQNSNVKTDSYGIFPEPKDNGLLGRGTADLILKENTALLRAGKTREIQRGVLPISNNNRAYLELDFFASQKETDEKVQKRLIQEKSIKLVKFLIEYNVYNADNQQDKFTGDISVYRLKKDILCNTENLKQESEIEQFKPAPIYRQQYTAISKSEVQELINTFIKGFNDGNVNIPGWPVFNPTDQFPFYFRLSWEDFNKLSPDGTNPNGQIIKENLQEICKGVNPFNITSDINFFGLVSAKDNLGQLFDIKVEEFQGINYKNEPITYSVMGADEMYFLSHRSTVPGKVKISIDKSVYGYTQDQIGIDIKDNTNSMVRGEQLLDLLNLIVKFLVSHVHPFHLLPPDPVGIDGTDSAQMLKLINEAHFKILNEYIRIN